MIDLKLQGEGAYSDLLGREGDIIHIGGETRLGITGLSGGMTSGRASVMLRIDLPDGKVVLAETSLRLFLLAADALRTYYGGQD